MRMRRHLMARKKSQVAIAVKKTARDIRIAEITNASEDGFAEGALMRAHAINTASTPKRMPTIPRKLAPTSKKTTRLLEGWKTIGELPGSGEILVSSSMTFSRPRQATDAR